MNMKKIYALLLALCITAPVAMAQDGEESAPQAYPVQDVFYGTRTVNFQTVEQLGKKVLAYRISHRFGSLTEDALYNWFGLDGPANISFMFDYGITDKLMVGLARDQFNKVYNGFVKWSPLQQTPGEMPVSLSVYGKANIISQRDGAADVNGFDRYDNFSHRMSYVTQVMVARKFGERFSLQVAPTWVHHNLVELAGDSNDMFALTASAQLKLTKRLGLSGEFGYVMNDYVTNPDLFFPTAAVALDIVTGGHVFSITLSNSAPINEAFAIPYTISDLTDGGLRLGFNISRNFWLGR